MQQLSGLNAVSGLEADPVADLTASIKAEASCLGFEIVGVAPAVTPIGIHHFAQWLDRGYAAEMSYMARRKAAYDHPRHVLDGVRSIVMLGMTYLAPPRLPDAPGLSREGANVSASAPAAGMARVARYAWGEVDYHDLIRERLARLGRFVARQKPGSRTRGIVDTAPLLERDFARLAGLGWFGKNTMLINKRRGSFVFLAALLTDLELKYDPSHEAAHCGTCTRCLDACPTGAFVEPYVLDARKCISYLTIEHRGPIPPELREGIGEWLFGCDVCQEVCPWNRKAPSSVEVAFQPRSDLSPADAVALLALSADEFRARFGSSPLKRPGRAGLLRNAAIVLGNRRDPATVPALIRALGDSEPLIRGACAWALSQFSDARALQALHELRALEDDPAVIGELIASHSDSSTNEIPPCPG